MNLFLKQFLLPILVVGLTSKSFCYSQFFSGGFNDDCRNSNSSLFRKPYERYKVNCCKDTAVGLTSHSHVYYSFEYYEAEMNCFKAAGLNDDLPTSMWKELACKWKIWTNTTEDTFTFKTVVDYLTSQYSNATGVQQLIINVNTECSDGDKEKEFHDRLQGYLNCFYSNEKKTCNNPTPEGVKEMNDAILIAKNSTIQPALTCPSMAGFWDETSYCCAGKQTPDTWKYMQPQIFKPRPNLTDHQSWKLEITCETSIYDILHAHHLQNTLPPMNDTAEISENSENQTTSFYDYGSPGFSHHYPDCRIACRLNPVLYTNDSSGPDMKFDFLKDLDLYFPNEAKKVQRDFKEVILRNKNSFKVPLTLDNSELKTYLTLEEIETQYSSLENTALKARYYCAYYDGITKLISNSHYGYCISDEALIHQLDPNTHHEEVHPLYQFN